MTTKNLVPRADGEGKLGFRGTTLNKRWEEVNAISTISQTTVTHFLKDINNDDFIQAGNNVTIDSDPATGKLTINSTSAGTTINELNDISNVTYTSSDAGIDNYFLRYSSTNNEWTPAQIPAINSLNDISNVTYTSSDSSVDDYFLRYDSTTDQWSPEPIPTINNLSDISDVGTYSTANNIGHVLVYKSTGNWEVEETPSRYWEEVTVQSSNRITPRFDRPLEINGNLTELFDLGSVSGATDDILDGGLIVGPVAYTADCGILKQENIF